MFSPSLSIWLTCGFFSGFLWKAEHTNLWTKNLSVFPFLHRVTLLYLAFLLQMLSCFNSRIFFREPFGNDKILPSGVTLYLPSYPKISTACVYIFISFIGWPYRRVSNKGKLVKNVTDYKESPISNSLELYGFRLVVEPSPAFRHRGLAAGYPILPSFLPLAHAVSSFAVGWKALRAFQQFTRW